MTSPSDSWWNAFVAEIAKKNKGSEEKIGNLGAALKQSPFRPNIYLAFGIHGNILFPDNGYCEFDDVKKASEYLQRWAIQTGKTKESPKQWKDAFPVGFEVGICSLEELSKIQPIWDVLKEQSVEFINPLYSQPYLRQIGEESNWRQFEYGINSLESHGLKVEVFSSSEHALHPQLPQLLSDFGINYAHATARLAGGAPTNYLPKVSWMGLDGSKITAIVSQSGLPNGSVWHGRIFEDFPSLIFLAVARPDLKDVVYTNIEDFANPFPGSAEIAAHIRDLERQRIYLRGFKTLVSNSALSVFREIKWGIDEFPIKLMRSKLISEARKCEDELIQTEAMDALLAGYNKESQESLLKEAWKLLLIAENHDAYVVPFTTPGLYSVMQGFEQNQKPTSTESIEDRSLRSIKEARELRFKAIENIQKNLNASDKQRVLLNWLWARQEVVEGQLVTLPTMGYVSSSSSEPYDAKLYVEETTNGLIVNDFLINISDPVTIVKSEGRDSPNVKQFIGKNCKGEIRDCYSRLELSLTAFKDVEICFPISNPLYITYPFGSEATSSAEGHSLRFFWEENGLLCVHTGTPYFKREPSKLTIKIPNGEYRFGLAKASSLLHAYQIAWEFFYPPILIEIDSKLPPEKRLILGAFEGSIPLSLRRSKNNIYIRVLSIDGTKPKFEQAKEVDFKGNPTQKTPRPWRILNYSIDL